MDKSEIEKLAEQVRYHNKKYAIEHNPEISDEEYDALRDKLKKADPKHAALFEIIEESNGKKVKHDTPMLSLEKVINEPEKIIEWAKACGAFDGKADQGLVVSYKVDGLSCSLLYDGGKLLRAATRGDGEQGDDVTENVKVCSGVPKTIKSLKKVEVRGEIYMSKASFNEAVAKFEALMKDGKAVEKDRPKNARNYCAGSFKQKDASVTKERNLSFLAHGVVIGETKQTGEFGLLTAIQKLGFETPLYKLITSPKEIEEAVASIGKNRKTMPYDTDGIVFGVNRLSSWEDLGATGHHPKYKMAYKFPRDQGHTEVLEILWETSRTGNIVPRLKMKPIFLGGATVNLCTLFHAKHVKDNNLAPGDTVLMEREVIPYFVGKTKSGGNDAKLPTKCPSCGTELEWDSTKTHLTCNNSGACPNQFLSYLEHYVSRKVCNMLGVGSEILEKLVDAKLVSSPADLFVLTEDKIADNLPHTGDVSAKKIVKAIQERKEQSLATFLQSLGIHKLGETVSERFAEHFGTLDKVLAASVDDMMNVNGVAEGIANSAFEGLKDRKKLIIDLCKQVVIKKVVKVDGPLNGQSFCLTGKVEIDYSGKKYDVREDIEDLIKSKGGDIKSVSKNLTYLIEGPGAGDKVEKAKKAGVKIIDGAKLLTLLK